MNILKKEDGTISKTNVFNLAVLLLALFEIFKPFIPVEYVPIAAAVIAAVNLVLRTFYSSGEPIQGVAKG